MGVSLESEAEEENDTLGIDHKTGHKVLKATKNKSRTEPVAISDVEEAVENIAADNGGAIKPLTTRGLKRSYAMLDILANTTGGDDPTDTEFEAPTESEEVESTSAGIVELNDDDKTPQKVVKPQVRKVTSAEIIKLDDEDETPKKKKVKPTVRGAIKAKQGQLDQVCLLILD